MKSFELLFNDDDVCCRFVEFVLYLLEMKEFTKIQSNVRTMK